MRVEREEALQHRDGEHPAVHVHRVTNVSNEFMARMNINSKNWRRSIGMDRAPNA
jgi:hypothetical protein